MTYWYSTNLLNIQDYSQIEAGKLKLNYSEFDIREVIIEVVEMMKFISKKKSIELLYEISPNVPE